MTDRTIVVQEYNDLGLIKLIDSSTRFPWEFFINGEINCAFKTVNPKGMNDIRIWINKNVEDTVYIERSRWGEHSCIIGFTNSEDAIKFSIKFGDLIKKFDG